MVVWQTSSGGQQSSTKQRLTCTVWGLGVVFHLSLTWSSAEVITISFLYLWFHEKKIFFKYAEAIISLCLCPSLSVSHAQSRSLIPVSLRPRGFVFSSMIGRLILTFPPPDHFLLSWIWMCANVSLGFGVFFCVPLIHVQLQCVWLSNKQTQSAVWVLYHGPGDRYEIVLLVSRLCFQL